ncbi:methyltransferase domain-containing protein [Candidatus Pacearchaeota archaeon]|nr:methyltransferase domain-containing protein [Candidatus Pacearchaeota archaeon]
MGTSMDDVNCTRLGRYSIGEHRSWWGGGNPIAQFFGGKCYSFPQRIEYKFGQETRIPATASELPSRINQFSDDVIEIVDVGCSTGGATLSFYELLRSLHPQRKITIRGFDNDKRMLDEALEGKTTYHSYGLSLHPKSNIAINNHFYLEDYQPQREKRAGFVDGSEDLYIFSLKPSSLPVLQSILNGGNGENLPLKDKHAHLTICSHVLRYINDQSAIFRELVRITKPGGYIFTEEYAFRRTEKGVDYLSPLWNDAAVSLYDPHKVIQYHSLAGGEMYSKEYAPSDIMDYHF